jgi:hypothetical protein
MSANDLVNELEQALESFAWMDPHTHLDAAHLSARGLDDILLYHMAVSDLYSSGCPSGARVDEDRIEEDARRRVLEALPHLAKVRNTSISWCIRKILADLYGWTEPITESNWTRLDRLIAERCADAAWTREMFRRNGIARTGTELWRGRGGVADEFFQYSLEWAFFARAQWGQPDIPLYELERAWNDDEPSPPIPVTFERAKAAPLRRTIRSVDEVNAAVLHYCDRIPYDRLLATAQHLCTDIDYSTPDAAAMARALGRRRQAGDAERDVYASYILNGFLAELERRRAPVVFQFSLAAEALPFESGCRINQRTIGQLGEIVARYPGVKFQCFLASRHANQSLCTLARELPNLSLAGYWWHNFFPGAIRQIVEERLDMLPLNRQIGFLSDAYCIEWVYAKKALIRRAMAAVLAQKVECGQYTFEDAVSIARAILFDSSVELLGMRAAAAGAAPGAK